MIPFGSRVGIGAIGAGVAAASGVVPVALLVALVAAATSVVARLGSSPCGGARGRRATVGILAGAWLVILRLAVAPAGPEAATLPTGAGPWMARVTTLSAPRDGQQRLTVTLGEPYGAMLAVTAPRYPAVEPGDLVRLAGKAATPPEGGYGDFLRRTGVTGTLRTSTLELVAHAGDPAGMLERVRRAAGDALTRALPEPAAGLAAGILVGLRDRVDRDLAAAFTATGLSHVVAISGWNIALVAGLVGAVLAGRARRTRSGAIVVAIAVYAVLAGASPSVVRAAAMTCVALLARESGRPGTAAAALGWAVALLIIVNPASAVDIGLQLSAAATAGLIAWSAPITETLDRRAGWLPPWIREGLGVSLAAQAATLPLVLFAFGRVAPLSPITNLAVVPLVPLAMAAGALALAGGLVAALGAPGTLASILGIPGALVLGLLIGIVRLAATLPFSSVTLPPARGGGSSAHDGGPPRVRRAPTDAASVEGASSRARAGAVRCQAVAWQRPPQHPDPPAGRPPGGPGNRRPGRCRCHTARRTRPRHRPRRRPGRRDPRDRADGRADARGRRTRPRPTARRTRRPGAAVGPADRPRRAHPPPRGPRCGPAARTRAVPRGPGGGAGHARRKPRIRGAVDDPFRARGGELGAWWPATTSPSTGSPST